MPISLNVLLKNQLKYLTKYFEVIAVSSAGSELNEVSTREGVNIVPIEMKREISVFKDLVSLLSLMRLFNKVRPDIVHANTPKASLLSMIAAKVCGVKNRIYTVTGLRFETTTGLKRKLLINMERMTCICASHVVAESDGVMRMIDQFNLTRGPVFKIGEGNINGIDESYWNVSEVSEDAQLALKRTLGIQDQDLVFIFVGRLVKDKGVNELVQAFSLLHNGNAKLLLVGSLEETLDPLEAHTLKTIEENNNIVSVGYQGDVRLFMSIADCLVLPSYREGFPNVILQAGAMGLPCICTNVNGVEEVINSENGLIVPKGDFVKLNEAMIYMLLNYNTFDKAYCRENVINRFSQSVLYPEIVKFYRRVLEDV